MPASPVVASALLMYAAATDNRQPSEEAAIGWANALDEQVTLADGKAAIDRHRATSTDWLMPAHINTEVRRIRKIRTDAIGAEEIPPADLAESPARALAWTREYRRARGDGEEHTAAEQRACDAVGVAVPEQIEGARRMPAVGHLVREVPT